MWNEFESKWQAENKADYEENMKKFLYMLDIYKSVKKHPNYDPLDGIEIKIKISKILNSL